MRIEQFGAGDPEVAVVGGIHGDEPCGVRAVEHFVDAEPAVDRPVAFVLANEEAVERDVRYVESDLNRAFPGDPDGETHEERLAHAIGEAVGDCTTLALHSTQSYEHLFALVDEVDDLTRAVCPRLSVDAVVETGTKGGRIFDAVPATVEVECGYQGSDRAAANAVQVTREFLGATGVFPDVDHHREIELPVFRLGHPIPKRAAEEYEVYAENFEEVLAGEPFAAADGEAIVAEEAFHPVLMSAYGYEDVFGYTAERVGTLSG
ncbi:MAG: succinylglutamate desuccinylase/aspartoacylase family protein [Haloarculaceae archaeon]